MFTRILLWILGAEWSVGYAGMFVTKLLHGQASDDALFRAFSRLWLVGGVGFVTIALGALVAWAWSERSAS